MTDAPRNPSETRASDAHRLDASPVNRDEIDLFAYLQVLWSYRYALIALAVVVGGATYLVKRAAAPMYEVSFRLVATEPAVGTQPTRPVNVAAYRELLQSLSLADGLLDEVGLSGPPHNLTPRSFFANHVTISPIPDTAFLVVTVRLGDPVLLVRLANRYAERAVQEAEKFVQQETEYATNMVKNEANVALERLQTAEQALLDFNRDTQIELLRADVETMLMRRPEALDLILEIAGERARLRQVEAELARHERVRATRRAVDSLPPLSPLVAGQAEPAERRAPADVAPTTGAAGGETSTETTKDSTQDPKPQPAAATPKETPARENLRFRSDVLDPYVNPVYETLERDLADSRSRLAGLVRRREELVARLKLDAPSADGLTKLYEAEVGLARQTRAYELAQTAYLDAANRYESERLQNTGRSARLQVLDPALPPDGPIRSGVLRQVLAASLIALTLGGILAIVLDATRRRRALTP